jgi:putative Mg2+ transporter-C (MgtC) family protein
MRMETIDIALRLSAAALVGVLLGLNRDLHGKPTGVRTLGLVGLGSAAAVVAIGTSSADASRVVQGILTGIGFLGAGVIVRSDGDERVRGLTTAACVWLTASIGAACGIGAWRIVLLSVPLVLAMLVFGGPFEKAIRRLWPDKNGRSKRSGSSRASASASDRATPSRRPSPRQRR